MATRVLDRDHGMRRFLWRRRGAGGEPAWEPLVRAVPCSPVTAWCGCIPRTATRARCTLIQASSGIVGALP